MTSSTPSPDDTLSVSERDMLGALEVLQTAADEPRVLAVLSDEEILGTDGEAGLGILGSPYLEDERIERTVASATAIRSLIARGLVNPRPEGREDEGSMVIGDDDPSHRVVQLDRTLAGLLTLRRIPEGMVIVHRTSSNISTTLGLYLFPEDGVLEEFVAADGFHHFSVPTREVIAERLAQFVDPHGAANEDDDVRELTAEEIASDSSLQDTRTLSVLTIAGIGEGRQATVFALSASVLLLDNGVLDPTEESSDGADGATGTMAISSVSPESLRDLLASLVPQVTQDED